MVVSSVGDSYRPLPVSRRLEDSPACVRPSPNKGDFDVEGVQGCEVGRWNVLYTYMIKNFFSRGDPAFGELVDHDLILESILELRYIAAVQKPHFPTFDPHAEGLLIHLNRPC